MRLLKLYPDQTLCFWLGFLLTGCFVALMQAVVGACLVELTQQADHGAFTDFFKAVFLYGIPAGFFAQLIGYWLRNLRPDSQVRWIWLSLLIPICTFLLAAIQVELVNMVECKSYSLKLDVDDYLFPVSLYVGAALVSGLLAIVIIALIKLIRKTVNDQSTSMSESSET